MRCARRLNGLFQRLIAAVPLSFVAAVSCGGEEMVISSVDADQKPPCPQRGAGFGCSNYCNAIPDGEIWPEDPDGGAMPAMHAQTCQHLCRSATTADCYLNPDDPSERTVVCVTMCSGRRPFGFDGSAANGPLDLGGFFADMARLEAASVHAFRTLARELRAHRAPRRLIGMTRRAAHDEKRHARVMRALAHRHGGTWREPEVTKTAVRSLEAIAIENAVEGCVRETFGALLATYQAGNARDPVIREAMARIARDETRHAALAWQVAGWLSGQLAEEARLRVSAKRRAAAL